MKDKRIESVLELIDPPKGFRPWHGGPTLMGCLRGIDAKEAAWKPAPDRHSIWELVLHIAYWKYRVKVRLNPEMEKGFPRTPADWPVVDDPTEKQWKEDKAFIKKEHEQLIKELNAFPIDRLDEQLSSDKDWTYRQLIEGIAAHDTYHIGQIQLMKRLYKSLVSE